MTMSYESSPGVLIAGAGPVGLSCALALARQGIAVTLIERGPDVYRAPRAMGYHWSALYGLDDLGVLDDMKTRGFLAHGIDMHVLRTGEVVPFSTDPLVGNVAHPYSITLGQDKLAEILIEHLAKYDHVRTLWQTTVTDVEQDDQRVIVTLDSGRRLAAPWLVAADGAASTIRPGLGLGFEGVTWPHNFIASNVRFDFSQLGYADNNYVIDPVLGAVLAKVTADGIWRVTWSEDAALPDEGVHERIERFLTALLPPGAQYQVADFSRYRMHQRAAPTMRAGRVVLVGDAAHATNPTSGFGLVGGLHDVFVLSEALGAIVRGELSDEVLDRYSEDRLTAFWTVSSPISTESKRLVFHSDDPDLLEVDLQRLRRIARNPAMLLAFWLQGSRIESPSLVTGRLLSDGRNTVGATSG
jgi:3-(3-hydroxy-phenyl)propionate hydroxylase